MELNQKEVLLIISGLEWKLDQTNDMSYNGNMEWKHTEKLLKRIRKETNGNN